MIRENAPYEVDAAHEARLTAWLEGWHSRDDEIEQLNREADYWYLRANNSPEQVAEIMQRRLDGAFAEIDRAFFAEVKA